MGLRNPRKKERKEYLSHNFSDSDSSVGSILGACLDGFDGDAWMLNAEGAQDDFQVGAAAGVKDPSYIVRECVERWDTNFFAYNGRKKGR